MARLVTDARLIGAERERPLADRDQRRAVRGGHPGQCRGRLGRRGGASLAGERPLGIQPYRRTIAQLRVDPPAPPDLPLVIDASERFYFKPEAGGRLWLSPHDETPCDALRLRARGDRRRHRHRPAGAGGRLAGRGGRAQMGGPQELRAGPAAGLRLQRARPRLLLVRGAGRLRHPDRARRRRGSRAALLLGDCARRSIRRLIRPARFA